MSKLVRLDKKYYTADFGHWCPGCQSGHEFFVSTPTRKGARWTFNQDMARPTFAPSMNIRVNTPDMDNHNPGAGSSVCHYFLRGGQLQFLSDCTHELRGQTVELPDIPDGIYLTSERL